MTNAIKLHEKATDEAEQPCPMMTIGRDLDHDEATQRREELQDRWDQYAEKLPKLCVGSVAEDAQAARVAYEKSGLSSRPEDAETILGLARPDADVATAMQAALMHVYAKSSADYLDSARDALAVFLNLHPYFSELRVNPVCDEDAEYPDFRIRRIIQMNIDGFDNNCRGYKENRQAAARFWSNVIKEAASSWDFKACLKFAHEHARMLADVGAPTSDATIIDLLGVKHLEADTARAIDSVLFAFYNSDRSNELSEKFGAAISALLIFIQNHPKLRGDNIFGSTIARRQNYVVADLPRN